MTLSTLLMQSAPSAPRPGWINAPDMDRTDWSGGGGGGWKGGKSNPNAALSALTLLAFLFFLNILQNCLKDTIGQNGMMVVMVPTNTETTLRGKRAADSEDTNRGQTSTAACHNWTDSQITDLVHSQVESHWTRRDAKPRIFYLKEHLKTKNNTETKKKTHSPANTNSDVPILNNKISTKLSTKEKIKESPKINIKRIKIKPEYKERFNKSTVNNTTVQTITMSKLIWTGLFKNIFKVARPFIDNILCCDMITCQTEKLQTRRGSEDSVIANTIRKTVSWVCKASADRTCDEPSSSCRSPLTNFLGTL